MAPSERDSMEPASRTRRGQVDTGAPSRDAPGSRQREISTDETPAAPRRNYALAITMALIVFALLIGVRVFWGELGGHRAPSLPQAETTQETPAPSN